MTDSEYIPAKVGPKPKYNPKMCQAILEVAATGGHIAAMRVKLGGICKATWYEWKQTYPEFARAVEQAELVSQAFYEDLGLRGVMGQIPGFNATTYALLMNNKFKDEYTRGTNGPSSHTEITYNTVNLSPAELSQKIAQKLEKLKNLGQDLSTND